MGLVLSLVLRLRSRCRCRISRQQMRDLGGLKMGPRIRGQRARVDRGRRLAKTHLAGPQGGLDGIKNCRARVRMRGQSQTQQKGGGAGALVFWWGFFVPLMRLGLE